MLGRRHIKGDMLDLIHQQTYPITCSALKNRLDIVMKCNSSRLRSVAILQAMQLLSRRFRDLDTSSQVFGQLLE